MKRIAIALIVLVIILFAAIASQPSTHHVVRSTKIQAPIEVVFAQLNDLKTWAAWSPWGKPDGGTKLTYADPSAGIGAWYAWSSAQEEVGEGKLTILDSKPNKRVTCGIDSVRPRAAKEAVSFELVPEADGVQVVWSKDGNNDFSAKAFSLMSDLDALIGVELQQGLEGLRRVSQEAAKKRPAAEAASGKAE